MERAGTWASGLASAPLTAHHSNLCELLIRDHPHRSIAIASSKHVLFFRHSPTTSEAIANGSLSAYRPRAAADANAVSKCMVELAPRNKSILEDYTPLTHMPIHGTLGLITINQDVFLCVINKASRAAAIRPSESVERIDAVNFYCLSSSLYDEHISAADVWDDDAASVYSQGATARRDYQTYAGIQPEEHPCNELRKLLSNGSFYYSTDFDLTNRLQDRPVNINSYNIDNFDESFLWNSFMIKPLVEFRSHLLPEARRALDESHILTSIIRGYCGTMTIPQTMAPLRGSAASGPASYLSVISRLSCRRAGTRFNARGIDDDGNVANFVETETTYWSPTGIIFSYVQVRGSVPVFWEQAADLVPGRQKITIARSPEGTQPAFDKHFDELEHQYGAVHVVNLLSETKSGEAELTALYRYGIKHCPLSRTTGGQQTSNHALLQCTEYDFHAETKAMGYEAAKDIRSLIEHWADGFAYYLAEEADDAADGGVVASASRRMVPVLGQEGTFRTNCLDCLDRTNLIQTIISQMAVEAFLGHRGEYATADFWMRHSSLWADNGDSLSKIYAGTGALKTSFTRHGKMSLSGAMADLRKSAQRLYHNNFTDPSRQVTIDMLLGRHVAQKPVHLYDPISDFVSVELSKRSAEFSMTKNITIWIGTFNLNGRTDGLDHDLSAWLCPPELRGEQPEIVVCGFQEIVELSPQQIMNSDPSRKQLWEKAVKQCLNSHAQKIGGEKYVLLRSGQLVGAALCIFVKASELENIKDVEGSTKKTGLSGMAGNKGAVAIRFSYANTQICFVTAHLAAGFANYEERNRDYQTINSGIRFQRGRAIDDHDTVIWLGDFNYRIGLDLQNTKELIRRGDLPTLYDNDQLNLQMIAGLAFPFYGEARIAFDPTYKFDVDSDEYDSSEKSRIPAWTDRILRKGTNLKQLSYNCAPLRFSDHRPVYAHFECTVNQIDVARRQKISEELYRKRKEDVGSSTALIDLDDGDTEDEEFIGYESVEPGLPPASSDRQRWWLENGQPARVQIPVPKTRPGQGNGGDHSNGSGNNIKAASGSTQMHGMALNPQRASNPFSNSEEPDWIAVPRSASQQSVASSISSSPYEVVNIPAMMTATRRPNQTNAPAKFSRLSISEGVPSKATPTATSTRQDPPPPPPPRRQASTASSTLSTSMSPPTLIHFNTLKPNTGTLPPSMTPRSTPRPVPTAAYSQPQSSLAMAPLKPMTTNSSTSSSSRAPPPVARKPVHLAASPSSIKEDNSSFIEPPPPLPNRASTLPKHQQHEAHADPKATTTYATFSGHPSPAMLAVEAKKPATSRNNGVRLPGMTPAPKPVSEQDKKSLLSTQTQAQSPATASSPSVSHASLPGSKSASSTPTPTNTKPPPPPLPTKRKPLPALGGLGQSQNQSQGQIQSHMDLLDDQAAVLGGWESLKPEPR
ncbi:Inositol-1,4,5-trisphosphate 5-phosphatase 1 [Ceratocystis fimbriata CBS 114723]|uniref:phosphoinositide 5-phosphatase n=1 Tax=Ceratocystis fimbriata CBS 114723 TaxID=1035309 RepID=A0A2C5X262_9PEZI|nr:Inositol-1,4,5-trisphosphate 5-phosphatase 1 [Ceratocystis fimbriata CBS 114723]